MVIVYIENIVTCNHKFQEISKMNKSDNIFKNGYKNKTQKENFFLLNLFSSTQQNPQKYCVDLLVYCYIT